MIFSFWLRLKSKCFLTLFSIISFTLLCAHLAPAQSVLPVPDADNRSFIVSVNTAFVADKTDSKAALTKMTEEGKRVAMKKIGLQLSKLKEAAPNLDFELVKTPTGFLNVLKKKMFTRSSPIITARYHLSKKGDDMSFLTRAIVTNSKSNPLSELFVL